MGWEAMGTAGGPLHALNLVDIMLFRLFKWRLVHCKSFCNSESNDHTHILFASCIISTSQSRRTASPKFIF